MLSFILRDDTYFLNSPSNLITILNLLLIDQEDQIAFCAFNGFNILSKFLLFKLNSILNKKNSRNKNILKNNTNNRNHIQNKHNNNHNNNHHQDNKNNTRNNNKNNNSITNNTINKNYNSSISSSSSKNISRGRSGSSNCNNNNTTNDNNENSNNEKGSIRRNQNEEIDIIESSIIILEKGLNWIDFSKNQKNIKKIDQLWGKRELLIDTFVKNLYFFEKNIPSIINTILKLINISLNMNLNNNSLINIFLIIFNQHKKTFILNCKKNNKLLDYKFPKYFNNNNYLQIIVMILKNILNHNNDNGIKSDNNYTKFQFLILLFIETVKFNNINYFNFLNNLFDSFFKTYLRNLLISSNNNNKNIYNYNYDYNIWKIYFNAFSNNLIFLIQRNSLHHFENILNLISKQLSTNLLRELIHHLISNCSHNLLKINNSINKKINLKELITIFHILRIVKKNRQLQKIISQKNFTNTRTSKFPNLINQLKKLLKHKQIQNEKIFLTINDLINLYKN
ncbi:hypothetical protein M0813_24974 [Anaeramoeba flamelloides]|uniref:Uncharacterized protein n=1 Tax=Anaeramoeba flamelloides TaxID=1746091 RepID=A0ABQ8Y581_9EUKA|nr:hypothetical protein M0813_24974 [Anaeramoeba flamelloides]